MTNDHMEELERLRAEFARLRDVCTNDASKSINIACLLMVIAMIFTAVVRIRSRCTGPNLCDCVRGVFVRHDGNRCLQHRPCTQVSAVR